MAVHWPIPSEVAEAEEHFSVLIKLEPCYVLARNFNVGNAGARGADTATATAKIAVAAISITVTAAAAVMSAAVDPAQDLVFFQMNVDRVLPIVAGVDKDPVLRAVLSYGEAEFITIRKLVVDDPLTVVSVEFEVASDSRRDDRWQGVERWQGCRIDAIVGNGGANAELHTIGAIRIPAGKDVALWSLPILLFQTVLQTNLGVAAYQTLHLVEVNDDVVALGYTQTEAGDLYRFWQQVAVIGDYPERNLCAWTKRIGEKQLVETRRPAVQHAEAIASLIDVQIRLNDAVCQLDVTEQSLEIERVEADLASVGIQQLVIQNNRDIELRVTGEPEACRFITCVELIKDQVKALEPFVSVLGSVVDSMVVIPHRAQRFVDVAVGRMR